MREILDEAFELLGDHIVIAHAKDLSQDGEAGHEAAGTGRLDYDQYLSLLAKAGFDGPLILHSLNESQVDQSVAFLRRKLETI
jgi:sugar phosphate isomerase/epimerase